MVEDIEMDNPSFRGGSGNPLINVNARQATPGIKIIYSPKINFYFLS